MDDKFREKARNRFKPPRYGCASSRVELDETIIDEESEILAAWAKHFEELGISKVSHSSQLQDAVARHVC